MAQVPVATNVTATPETVHTEVIVDAYAITNELLVVAAKSKLPESTFLLAIVPKVMLCALFVALVERVPVPLKPPPAVLGIRQHPSLRLHQSNP